MSTPFRFFAVIASFMLALLGGVFHSSAAFAQEDAEESNILEEVYVTATKRDERLVDVPMAVTALKGSDLVERNLLQIEEFADQVPGLVVEQFGNRATRVILRGLNSGGAGATVATLIDETALSYSVATTNGAIDIANLGTYDLNRIEVLRGPQGTIYGAAAEGGVIKYVTNAPKLDRFEGDAEVGVETIKQGDTGFFGQGILNLPFANGTAALRITGYYKDIAGYIDSPLSGLDNVNDGERYGGRVQLLFEPTDNFSVRLMALMQNQNYGEGGSVELVGSAFTPGVRSADEFDIANGGDLQWNTITPGFSDNAIRVYSALLEWSGSSVNVLSATSYGEVNSTFGYDISFAELAPGFTILDGFAGLFGGPPVTFLSRQTNDLSKFNQEVRITSKETIDMGSIGFDWLVGGFYSDEDITFNQFFDAVDPTTGEIRLTNVFGFPAPIGGSELPASYKEISGFGEVVLHFTDKFDMAIGGRYSSNKQESQVTNFTGIINAPFDIVNPLIETDESKFTWSIAPSYHLTDDKLIYARVATGYRPGGPSLLIPGAPPDFPESYTSDSTVNYEIGTKGTTEDGRLTYDVAAFYIDWTDIQILTQFISGTSGQTFTITGNAGKARSQGLEWNVAWEITEGLVLSDNGAWVNAELTESARGLGGVDGDQLPMVPEWTNTLSLNYSTNISNAFVTMGVSWVYTGARFTGFGAPSPAQPPEDERFPGSHLKLPSDNTFSAQVTANFEKWRVRLYVQNLTDERVLTFYGTGGGFNATGNGQIIQPRTIGLSVGASF